MPPFDDVFKVPLVLLGRINAINMCIRQVVEECKKGERICLQNKQSLEFPKWVG